VQRPQVVGKLPIVGNPSNSNAGQVCKQHRAVQDDGNMGRAADCSSKAQQDKMKTCNAEAKGMKGDERKKFMSDCLKKGETISGSRLAAPFSQRAP
jgi:hypothetical protein